MRRKTRTTLDTGLLRPLALLIAFALVLLCAAARGETTATRLALVIGNSAYEKLTPLRNAAGDAEAIAAKLQSLGFEVALLTDPTAADFNQRLDEIVRRAETAQTVLFYYAGHAFQMDGTNYLVPVGARLDSLVAVRNETWSLDAIIARLQHRKRQTLIFLDACRNDPRPQAVRENGAAEGLARVQIGDSTYVAFATAPGMVTYDGAETAGRSPFTEALLANIGTPGQSISDMMIRVRNQVEQQTFRRQTPWEQSSLLTQFHFAAPTSEAAPEMPAEALERLAQRPEGEREAAFDALRIAGVSDEKISQMRSRVDRLTEGLNVVGGPSAISFGAPTPTLTSRKDPPATTPTVSNPFADLPSASSAGSIIFGRTETVSPETTPVELAAASPIGSAPTPHQSSVAPASIEGLASPPLPIKPSGSAQTTMLDQAPPVPSQREAAVHADIQGSEASALRLAALAPEALGVVRGLPGLSAREEREAAPQALASLRLKGRELDPQSREFCATLHAADPSRFGPCAPDEKELALMIQGELKRIGCYRGAIDGEWGPGSRAAVLAYQEAAKLSSGDAEPSAALLASLEARPEDLCKPVVAALPKAPSTTEPRRSPAAKPKPPVSAPKPVVRTPPPKPSPAPVVTQRQSPSGDNRARARRIIN